MKYLKHIFIMIEKLAVGFEESLGQLEFQTAVVANIRNVSFGTSFQRSVSGK